MGFTRTNWRGLRMAFIMSLFLVEIGPTRQPLLFVVGYVDTAALLLFVLWLLYKFARTIIGLARRWTVTPAIAPPPGSHTGGRKVVARQ
jgi:hypothetical protein